VLSDYGGPYRGSFVPMLSAIGRAARARGWEAAFGFTPVARDRPWLADLRDDGLEVRFTPGRDRREIRAWIANWLAELSGPVVVHTHFTRLDVAALTAARGRRRTPVFWHVHTFLPSHPARAALATVKYGVRGRRVAATICVSDEIAASIRRRGGARRRTVVVENGIDTERFTPGAFARNDAREALGVPSNATLLFHFSWDWEMKGGPLFAEMLASMRRAGSSVVGVSVGGGESALATARRLGIESGLLAIDPVEDSRLLYAAADAIAATSAAEGGPYAMLEALASGVPVVASDIPAHRLSVPVGVRLAPLPAEPLAAAAREVFDLSASRRADDAATAREWVVRERGLDRWIDRVFGLYDSALR
jgi:glycosyltransferase involved in cell wall biosynthesis